VSSIAYATQTAHSAAAMVTTKSEPACTLQDHGICVGCSPDNSFEVKVFATNGSRFLKSYIHLRSGGPDSALDAILPIVLTSFWFRFITD
jgi:hypothetical protein